MRISYYIPVQTKSEANLREHWAVRAKRAKAQRFAAHVATDSICAEQNRRFMVQVRSVIRFGGTRITLTRIAKRDLDSDNLAGSGKHIRDGIADSLRIDDGAKNLDWQYRQRRPIAPERPGCVHVLIEKTDIRVPPQ